MEAEHLDQPYRIERYPEFRDGIANDVALVQLRDPISAGRVATLYHSFDEIGKQVVFVGRQEPRKGLQVLLRAWPEIHRRTGARLRRLQLPCW
jgi:hypothetical protein